MVFIKSDYDKCKSPILNSKIITIPRYLCNHREFNNKIIKIPQIFFIGNLTGGYKMEEKLACRSHKLILKFINNKK